MPKVISKKVVVFFDENSKATPQPKFKLPQSIDSPVEIPTWVTQNAHFKLLVSDGSIIPADGFQGANGKPTKAQLDRMSDVDLIKVLAGRGYDVKKKAPAKAEGESK